MAVMPAGAKSRLDGFDNKGASMFRCLLLSMAVAVSVAQESSPSPIPSLQNPGFESPSSAVNQISGWDVSIEKGAQGVLVQSNEGEAKAGKRSLEIVTRQGARVRVSQELFLPVGTTWKASVWVRGEGTSTAARPANRQVDGSGGLEVESPAGDQGKAAAPAGTFAWQREEVDFRVPSPGRIRVALLTHASGKLWFDDVRLEPLSVTQDEDIHITSAKIGGRPIDLKQGAQFIEPLCHMIPSMLAQQVQDDSFEDEPPCKPSYIRQTDWPHRPWYPSGAVHDATFSLDTVNPYNGKQSEKIAQPMARARAGISQDGYYVEQGVNYRLRLHMRGIGSVPVWASLRSPSGVVAEPVLLGRAGNEWQEADVLLRANRTLTDATLSIEFEGPGTLWVDRVYLIGEDAVLGLWRPDAVRALKEESPGLIRFGGSMIEVYEWDKSIGPWDTRVPYPTGPWGGLEPNFVGIDEFVQLTRYVGAEPLICIRWSNKTPQDAADEVEYLNGSVETRWGKVRAQNGHPEPYRVKYWQIGNEVGGGGYDDSVRAFAAAMRKADPSIKILSSFPSADTLREGGGYLDYLCPHHYEVANLRAEQADFDFLKDQIAKYAAGKDVHVAVTEWNTTAGEMGLTRGMLLTLGNALSNSRYQNLLHRYADTVEIAVRSNLSDSFGSGMIQPGIGWLYLSPTYYSQKLYQAAAGTYPLKINRGSAIPWQLEEPDLSATLSADGKTLRVFAVNSTAQEEKTQFHLDGFPLPVAGGTVTVLKDRENALDSEAMNTTNDPNRIATSSKAIDLKGGEFRFSFEPFTVTMLELKLGAP
jgi:alpha-L-arabinofuranosidase